MQAVKKKLLVVEDIESILEVMKITLEDAGYLIETAGNGEELKLKLQKKLPGLVILDYWLPGENGGILTKYIKNTEKTNTLPVIMISANHNIEKTAYACGVDAFLPKHFDIAEFLATVKKYLIQE